MELRILPTVTLSINIVHMDLKHFSTNSNSNVKAFNFSF